MVPDFFHGKAMKPLDFSALPAFTAQFPRDKARRIILAWLWLSLSLFARASWSVHQASTAVSGLTSEDKRSAYITGTRHIPLTFTWCYQRGERVCDIFEFGLLGYSKV